MLSRWSLVLFALLAAGPQVRAASAGENRAFDSASKDFSNGIWDRAESEFGAFRQTFTNSSRLPEAVLFQAEARFQRTNYDGAMQLLSAYQDFAGNLGDEYLFWQGQAAFEKRDFKAAADLFARLVHVFPASPRRLEAALRQANSYALRSDWGRVAQLLEQTNGVFQTAARTNLASELVSRGFLLLGEAQIAEGNIDAAQSALKAIGAAALDPELAWQRQQLFCRVSLARGRLEEAFQQSTNLPALAAASKKSYLEAETAAFQADILEQLGRTQEAIAAYQRNLGEGVPAGRQRQALLKITQLSLAQTNESPKVFAVKIAEAAQTLEKFLARAPLPDSADLALLTLGELRLRQYEAGQLANGLTGAATNALIATNYLQEAISAFERFTTNFPKSSRFGKVELDLGWCFLRSTNLPASQAAFRLAVERLPVGLDQAIAYFKLADVEYLQTNFPAAISNYQAVIDKFAVLPQARTNLLEPAFYQIIRAGLASGNLPAATNALAHLLHSFPDGFYSDRAVLLTGQAIGPQNPAGARRLFLDFAQGYPADPLLPELQLAIARTYELQNQWTNAIPQYDQWLAQFTNNPARPRAEYFRARADFEAGRETNALRAFTAFVADYPTNELAPMAQWWVADYYYSAGNFWEAEKNYQLCYQNTNWPPSELSYQAQMMAGRSAFGRQGWKDARDYFTTLALNTNCPAGVPPETFNMLRAQAFFALGDTLLAQDSTNRLADAQDAISAFNQIFYLCPSNQLAVLAWGEKANCFLTSQDYGAASNAFQMVLDSPLAAPAARSMAKVGQGVILEKLAEQKSGPERGQLLLLASNSYLDVYDGKILRDGEKADPYWKRKAGIEAARLQAEMKHPGAARRIYQDLHDPRFEDKINALQAQETEATRKD